MGQASPLPLSQPLRSRHRGSTWSSGSQRPRVRHPAKPIKHTHPHHDPRPLSEEILSAQGRGVFSKTVVVPRRGAPPRVIHRNTPTWQTESPDSRMLSVTFTLTWVLALKVVLANTRSDCINSVSAGRNSTSRKTFLPGRGNGRGCSL